MWTGCANRRSLGGSGTDEECGVREALCPETRNGKRGRPGEDSYV